MKKENIFKKLREDYEFKKNGKRLTMNDLADIFQKQGYSTLTYNAIRKLETGNRFLKNNDEIIAYATFFNVTADYLLGIRNTAVADENIQMIGRTTGLCDEAIYLLKEWNSNQNNLFIQNDLDILNTILKEYYDRYDKNVNKPIKPSILHLLGDFIALSDFKIAPLEKISIKTSANDCIIFKEGKKVNNSTIEEIHDGRIEDFKMIDSDYSADRFVPIIKNNNEELNVIELDEELISTTLLNKIKKELEYLREYIRRK